jgi:ABC-type microcin C transport system duplicated ATPase subunit YejF
MNLPPRWMSRLLRRLQDELSMSVLVISHNIHLIRQLADELVVMLDGRIVEQNATTQVLKQPQHVYTQRLLAAQPRVPGVTAE